MDYVIAFLQEEQKKIEALLKKNNLMAKNINQARACLLAVGQLKRAIKTLKAKQQQRTQPTGPG